jgi:hypothetical protein
MIFDRVDYSSLGRFNIFLFNGPQTKFDQYDGIMIARQVLEKSFITIVDDPIWRQVRFGSFRPISDAGYSIACSVEIRTTEDNTHSSFTHRAARFTTAGCLSIS